LGRKKKKRGLIWKLMLKLIPLRKHIYFTCNMLKVVEICI